MRAQVDKPELGAELADAVQDLAQTGLVDVAMPKALRQMVMASATTRASRNNEQTIGYPLSANPIFLSPGLIGP